VIESSPLYTEQQEFPFRRALFVVFFLMFAAIPAFLDLPLWMTLGILAMGVLVAGILNSLLILRVVITNEHLEFGFWISSPKLVLSDIKHVELVAIPKLAGAGVHRWREFWVYNANWGRGLKVMTDKKAYMIGSDNPEQLYAALQDAMRRPAAS
jgi:hypothetical protein